jgi:FkbM family methyltransferase
LDFWWSYFPRDYSTDAGTFGYWGADIGDLRFLWKWLRQGMAFLDVGAHHGMYSLIASKKIQKTGHVVAFEPSPREQRRLGLHLRMNRVSSVTLEPYAVGARTGKACLFAVVSKNTTMNSLRRPAIQHPVQPISVNVISLDDYLEAKPIEDLGLIKLDAEGGELEVLRGARRVLEELRPAIICEVLDWVTGPWGYAARDIVSHLQNYDYRWFDIQPDGTLSPHAAKDLYPEVRNYVAVPEEGVCRAREFVV